MSTIRSVWWWRIDVTPVLRAQWTNPSMDQHNRDVTMQWSYIPVVVTHCNTTQILNEPLSATLLPSPHIELPQHLHSCRSCAPVNEWDSLFNTTAVLDAIVHTNNTWQFGFFFSIHKLSIFCPTVCLTVYQMLIKWLGFWHIEAETKWPPFSRRHFQMHFLERICMNVD